MAHLNEPKVVHVDQEILSRSHFELVGEGAANLVFAPSVPQESSPFEGKLLRVAKAGKKSYPHKELQEYWESRIKPEFGPNDLVAQSLIQLAGTDIVSRLNEELARTSGRRDDFEEDQVADVEYGMLVEDMRKLDKLDHVIQFKLKWLLQSRNAPKNANRCRSCAREAQRLEKIEPTQWPTPPTPSPCPLVIMYLRDEQEDVPHDLQHKLLKIWDPGFSSATPVQQEAFVNWMRYSPLIGRLRELQEALDPLGVLETNEGVGNFAQAMTLRDCTVFVRINAEGAVEAKLGDLDRKNADAKWPYWHDTETRLLEGGYYTRKERPMMSTRCLLEWAEWHPEWLPYYQRQ